MPFQRYTREQYRTLDPDGLDARREEVRAELEGGDTPLPEMKEEVRLLNEEVDRRGALAEVRAAKTRGAIGSARVLGSFGAAPAGAAACAEPDPYDTPEYRAAFKDWCCRGVRFERSSAGEIVTGPTVTGNVAPQVPTTMQKQIVQVMEEHGTIYNEVTKISVPGGVWFRVVDIVPEAKWVGETEVSPEQGYKGDEKVSFTFFEVECRMSQTLLAGAVTFEDFQALFVPAVAKAMVKAIEKAIVSGNGTTQPLGLLNDPRVNGTGKDSCDPRKAAVVEMTAEQFGSWKAWRSDFKAKLPGSYRAGKIYMPHSTFDCYVETMSDDNNAPVSTGYNPVTGAEVSRLAGFPVEYTPDGALPDFDEASAGDVVAIYGDMSDYYLNTQPKMPITTVRWVDHDTNKEKMKSLAAMDGKALVPYGFVLIKKKASAAAGRD